MQKGQTKVWPFLLGCARQCCASCLTARVKAWMSARTRLITYSNPSKSGSNKLARRAGNRVRRGKRPAPGTKTPGAFLNNATRWPGNGRTSGMRCVIARAERPGTGLSVFPICPCSLSRLTLHSKSGQTLLMSLNNQSTAALFNRCRQLTQHFISIFPADTGVGDAFAIDQRLAALQALVAFHQMTLNHHTDNRLLTVDQLL